MVPGYDDLTVFRLASAILMGICAFQMLLLLSNYWHNVVPLRKEIMGGEIVAPPVFWTLAYHSLVFGVLVVLTITRIQVALRGDPTTFGTWAIPALVLPLTVVISKFQTAYTRTLRSAIHERDARLRTCPGGPAGSEGVEGGVLPGDSGSER